MMRWLATLVLVAGCDFRVSGLPISVTDPGVDGGAIVDLAVVDPPGALGDPCTSAFGCESGHCVDGVCCDSLCDPGDPANLCKACNVAGSEGHCVAAAAGTDPHQQCDTDPVASCGRDGLCDGMGGCRKYVGGTACGTASCSGGSVTQAPACDGDGNCIGTLPMSCAPYTCGSSTACATTCTPPANGCAPPAVCNNGSCGQRAAGQPCSAPSDCQSNFCAPPGVCCNQACTGICQSCSVTGKVGTCSPLAAGTQCAPPGCMGDSSISARTCDGAGTCQAATTTNCTPYTCNMTNGSCYARRCQNNQQCAAGHTCKGPSGKCQ